ncbi:hypothetical protein C4K37_4637 [Pseudomonas chlororaphis subsp. piscium]|nr:hypothetical protein C4K37_4637 [Pseudomonas chlororaphis subsp. piscium]AZC45560.1 hypothetical protein C4K36_4649 [Pseudomonas chlororaphis subsp. piscium]
MSSCCLQKAWGSALNTRPIIGAGTFAITAAPVITPSY